MLLTSEQFLCSYVNQLLVEYNITCDSGQPAFIQFEALNLEPNNCDLK